MTRTVLVLSGPDDPTADAVINALGEFDATTIRMDLGEFPSRMTMQARLDERIWRGALSASDRTIELTDVDAVYYRRPTHFTFVNGLSKADEIFSTSEAQFGLGGVLAALDDVLWVNNPAKVALAEYKPVQLRVATRSGLKVPRTLVTNDYTAAKSFAAAIDQALVCKTLSSPVFSEDDQIRIAYTTPIDLTAIDPDSLATTAHLLQEQVPKNHDARVTMVRNHPHAVAIHASSVTAQIDWRADYDAISYEPILPPEHVVAGMLRYLNAFGLEFGAFDFVVNPQGDWVFLECNPSGQWLWLEKRAGLPIAATLAELLATVQVEK